jgi:hypothetical protein
MCGLTNRCSGRRSVPVPLLAIVSIFVGNKRASHLAPLSSGVRRHWRRHRGINEMKTAVVMFAIALLGAIAVHLGFDISLGVSILIFFVGWPLVGTLVTLDDDLKGGWSNPDGTVRPPWLQAPFWGQIVIGFAIAGIGFSIDSGWQSPAGIQYILLATAGSFIGTALLTRRWWLLLCGAASAGVWGVMRGAV